MFTAKASCGRIYASIGLGIFVVVCQAVTARAQQTAAPELKDLLRPILATKLEDRSRLLYRSLQSEAHLALDRRQARYDALKTPEQCKAWQVACREFFQRQLGGFPRRGPLAARVTGTLQGRGFRVEKVIYQSRPNHHVTSSLYLPDTKPGQKPPFPAVLIACGHTKSGKAAAYNQQMAILLAKNGIAALCYDPIGQGERSQVLTKGNKPLHTASTSEHFLIGTGSILVGTSTAQYRAFDGIRGIDYLVSRKDIDPARIGCTGCSGGGTLTSYIMALDPRVACAAPACYLTTFRHLIDSIGPQDSEQNVFGQLAYGMDHPDYVMMRAPRPTLICSTTDDYFNIDGAWENFRQSKRFYGRLGHPERVDLVEADGGHGVRQPTREAMVQWMRRWLLEKDNPVREEPFDVFSESELQCLPRGQVLLLDGEQSVFDLNRLRYRNAKNHRAKFSARPDRDVVRKLAAIRPLQTIPVPRYIDRGTTTIQTNVDNTRYKLQVRRVVLMPKLGVPLPAVVLRSTAKSKSPRSADSSAYLIAGSNGRSLEDLKRASRLAAAGHLVMVVDLSGYGETSPGKAGRVTSADWKEFYLADLLGKSLVGIRAEDLLQSARYLQSQAGGAGQVKMLAGGAAIIPALHAAALEPDLVAAVRKSGGDRLDPTKKDRLEANPTKEPTVWVDMLSSDKAVGQDANAVHGALLNYDLSDLVRMAANKSGTAGTRKGEGRGD